MKICMTGLWDIFAISIIRMIVQEWTKGMKAKNRASFLKRIHRLGRSRLGAMQIQFNEFQKMHDYQLKKDHWRNFVTLIGFGRDPFPDCKGCQATLHVCSQHDRP